MYFSCPILAPTSAYLDITISIPLQKDKYHTGQPYPSLLFADGVHIACIGFMRPGHS